MPCPPIAERQVGEVRPERHEARVLPRTSWQTSADCGWYDEAFELGDWTFHRRDPHGLGGLPSDRTPSAALNSSKLAGSSSDSPNACGGGAPAAASRLRWKCRRHSWNQTCLMLVWDKAVRFGERPRVQRGSASLVD